MTQTSTSSNTLHRVKRNVDERVSTLQGQEMGRSQQPLNCWKFLGPSLLVSVGYMDPGNWATDLEGGARFGYSLLWVLLLSNAIALLLQSLSARLGIASAKLRGLKDEESLRRIRKKIDTRMRKFYEII